MEEMFVSNLKLFSSYGGLNPETWIWRASYSYIEQKTVGFRARMSSSPSSDTGSIMCHMPQLPK